jgi:serine protease
MRVRLALALVVALCGLTAWMWRGSSGHPTPSSLDQDRDAALASHATLIVDFHDDVPVEALANNGLDEQPISRFSAQDRMYRIHFDSLAQAEAAAVRLRSDPLVESVDYDVPVSLLPEGATEESPEAARPPMTEAPECAQAKPADGFPNDPCFRYQWHLAQIDLPAAWKFGQGKGATVAVIDTGVSRVPDLAATTLVAGYNFMADRDQADDDHGHGTHVAGTIAQATHNGMGVAGVAFEARIMPLKVLSASGSGSMAAIAQAIRFAADHGANVINMSLGGPFPIRPVRRAIDYARGKGVVVIAAAGNDGHGRVGYPARYPGVIAVAATQFDERPTFYSNWGREIDIAAPGGNIRLDQNNDGKPDGVLQNTIVPGLSARTSYLWFMGTSMAAPHVSGVAALVVGAGVTRPDAVESVLLDTARKPESTGAPEGRIDDRYGAGIVNAEAALKKARSLRGGLSLSLGAGVALVGLSGRRRMRLGRGRLGFAAAVALGASGLFFLPHLSAPVWLSDSPLGTGILMGSATLLGPAAQSSPLLWSALVPLGAIALLYGVRPLRPILAGLAFGVAGALLFAACAHTADLRPEWLGLNAAFAVLLGAGVLRE